MRFLCLCWSATVYLSMESIRLQSSHLDGRILSFRIPVHVTHTLQWALCQVLECTFSERPNNAAERKFLCKKIVANMTHIMLFSLPLLVGNVAQKKKNMIANSQPIFVLFRPFLPRLRFAHKMYQIWLPNCVTALQHLVVRSSMNSLMKKLNWHNWTHFFHFKFFHGKNSVKLNCILTTAVAPIHVCTLF